MFGPSVTDIFRTDGRVLAQVLVDPDGVATDALQDAGPGLIVGDPSVLDPVRRALAAMREASEQLGLDPGTITAALLAYYPGGVPGEG